MTGWNDGWTEGKPNPWVSGSGWRLAGWMGGWMDGWVDDWMDGWVGGWMAGGWMERGMDVLVDG